VFRRDGLTLDEPPGGHAGADGIIALRVVEEQESRDSRGVTTKNWEIVRYQRTPQNTYCRGERVLKLFGMAEVLCR